MKVAITGHTKGIGKAIAELYPGHIGFSRSNGYDITTSEHRERILSESEQCDIFINNAFEEEYQIDMFEEIFEQWRDLQSKTIVNLNSRTKYMSPSNNDYWNTKIKLGEQVNKHLFDRECRIININPGFVLTDTAKPSIDKYQLPYISTQECAQYIKWAIDQPIEIFDLSFWKHKGIYS